MSAGPHLDLTGPLRLVPDTRLRTKNFGRILISHQPVNFMRLGTGGADLVAKWFAGSPVSSSDDHRDLAHRLVAGGYAHYTTDDVEPAGKRSADGRHDPPGLTVVIPVRDDGMGLSTTVNSLLKPPRSVVSKVIIVDDGSRVPIAGDWSNSTTDKHPPVQILRSSDSAGPAGARNRGLAHVATPMVAFVDAGVVVEPQGLAQLVTLARHPGVAAAAPRIKPDAPETAIGRYERASSPLDMGPDPSVVASDHRVGYVPSACLVCRTESVRRLGGFDHSLRFGEDVDLVWRMADHELVLYQPAVEATHPSRSNLIDFARQRYGYGTSAGPLSTRHSGRLRPLGISSWVAVALILKAALGTIPWLWTVAGLVFRRTSGLAKLMPSVGDPWPEATLLVSREVSGQLDGVLHAARRPLSPLLVAVAVGGGRLASPVRLLLAAAAVRRATKATVDSPGQLAGTAVLAAVDDLAYSTGVLAGSLRCGTVAPLVPAIRRDKD